MTQDDRMETITDPEQIRAVWEAGDMGEESLGGDSESGTYNRSNRPPAGPRPDADNPWALLPDDHPERPKQCGGCGTKWVDAETARACERRHGDDITTPAPVGAAVALDLDADSPPPDEDHTHAEYVAWSAGHWRRRARAAEAEVVTLRAQVNGLHEELLRDDPDVVTLRAQVAAVEAEKEAILGQVDQAARLLRLNGKQADAQTVIAQVRRWPEFVDRAALATGEGE